MSMNIKSLFVCLLFALPVACSTAISDSAEEETGGETTPDKPIVLTSDVTTYVTTADGSQLFKKSTSKFSKAGSMSPNQVKFAEDASAKEVDGFGFAFTTGSCYNLMKMSQSDRTKFLKEMFSKKEGLGSSLIRVSIGGSDFSLNGPYTWCDTKGISNFAVPSEDKTYLFPVLKEIYKINPDVKIIAAPWSCPKWMKGGTYYGYEGDSSLILEVGYDSWTSGRLKPSCYSDYATYFVKWVQAMRAEGFDIYAISMQNEPLNHGNSMSMFMSWKDQRDFLKVLGPAMKNAGLSDVKILLFDHNYNYDGKDDQRNYPLNIYADSEASQWAAGSAWHNYSGDVSELDNIHSAYPDKDIYFTEASIGSWNYNFSSCLLNDFSSIFLGTLSRGGMGVTLWNVMLDENNKPYSPNNGSCKTCYGGVTIQSSDYHTITKNSQWYNVAHASAVIKPGARKMTITSYRVPSDMEIQMYKNTDGTIGVIVCNKSSDAQTIVFGAANYTATMKIPAKCLASSIWTDK